MRAWAAAVRPPSLLLALAPVGVGASMGYWQSGALDWKLAALALAAAVLMQLITNLQNDVGFTTRGAQHLGAHTGLPRATTMGWLSTRQVRIAILILSVLACGLGLSLVALRGWPVLAMGVASLCAALAYMGGPRPIAYTAFGELTVFVFFGLVAVLGTQWLLTGGVSIGGLMAAVAVGALAAAALVVNNHRDIAHDHLAGRRTFAVTWGQTASWRLYRILLSATWVMPVLMALALRQPWMLLPLVLLPRTLALQKVFTPTATGAACNAILIRTFWLEMWFSILLSTAAMLARVSH
ncbi:MAG: 1,4-dihydroxy-2-naphthoate octaprenyltransferase [Burkholderiales bacterium]|nr:1,4-dihydroxy-2-naphthoate octaprenyltransferase [Burkholderiales bacterium]MBK7281876.1 1,4-dihydroxy-2-naphthoate octaprenyltransferase [Burkholderiales bacterium]MBL0242612.1 1,4-dihydroxy-2-naphthoate octaprenyltransferase [Rhodoferax sp.]